MEFGIFLTLKFYRNRFLNKKNEKKFGNNKYCLTFAVY